MTNDESLSDIAEEICRMYEGYFETELDMSDPKIVDILNEAEQQVLANSKGHGIPPEGVVELFFESLVDWSEWSNKESIVITPQHLKSKKMWKGIFPDYINRHPENLRFAREM